MHTVKYIKPEYYLMQLNCLVELRRQCVLGIRMQHISTDPCCRVYTIALCPGNFMMIF